jgi:hypothetical protein
MFVGPRDTFYLSSKGGTVFDAPLLGSPFSPLAVDDVARINGVNTSLGQPYGYQPDHPPVLLGPPIEANFVPQAEMSITLPVGKSTVLFELLDVVHDYYGHTAIYLVRDCGIWLTGANPTSINWISHEHKVSGTPPEFEVRWGVLSQLTGGDPVEIGIIASISRPEGNATGVTLFLNELAAKRLELLREMIPNVPVVAFMVNPTNPRAKINTSELQAAARIAGQQIVILNVSHEREFEAAFARLLATDALVTTPRSEMFLVVLLL